MRDTDCMGSSFILIGAVGTNLGGRWVEDMQNTQKTAGFLGRRAEAPNLIFLYKKRLCAPKMLDFFFARAETALACHKAIWVGRAEKSDFFLSNSTLLYFLLKSRRFSKPT